MEVGAGSGSVVPYDEGGESHQHSKIFPTAKISGRDSSTPVKADPYATRFQRGADVTLIILAIILVSLLWGSSAHANWQGAVSGSSNDNSHEYTRPQNWPANTIDDSFAGTTFTGDTTLYFNANRTTVAAGLNLGYGGAVNLTLMAASTTPRTLSLAGNVGGDFGGSGNNQTVTIGNATNVLNVSLNGGTRTFTVSNGDTLSIVNTISGTLGTDGLIKAGAGTLILGGANTYGGGTSVTGGRLLVTGGSLGGGTSGTGTGNVTVNGSGTTLGGTGRISGPVTLGNTTPGAVLNPGPSGANGTAASVGTLTVGALTLTGANTVHIDAFGTATSNWDKLVSSGAISLGAGLSTLEVSIASGLTFTPGTTYTLLMGSSLTGTFNGIADGQLVTFNGYGFTADYTGTTFDLIAIPEPGTWVVGALGFFAVMHAQRRRLRILVSRVA